jgi:hypothetical protein
MILPAFVEIYDFAPGNLFAWQLMRGNFGASVRWHMHHDVPVPLLGGISPSVSVSYHHESDHYLDREFENAFLTPGSTDFDNSTFSSFEYLRLSGIVTSNDFAGIFTPEISFSTRWFPPPFATGQRKLKHSFAVGFQIQTTPIYQVDFYAAGFYERLATAFVAAEANFNSHFDHGNLIYRVVEIGGAYSASPGVRFNPFISYIHSNGRGLDFLSEYEEWGWGFRISW